VTELNNCRNKKTPPGASQTAAVSRCVPNCHGPARTAGAAIAAVQPTHPLIRPIASSDSESYRSILLRTTPEDLYCRFFHVVDHIEECDIAPFVEPRVDTIGFIAEDGTKPLGVAHAFLSPNHS
jgi:hypothetical protein